MYWYRDRKISDRHTKRYACLMGENIYFTNSKHDVTTSKMVFLSYLAREYKSFGVFFENVFM